MGQVKRDSIINTFITYSGIGLGYLNKGLLFPLLLLPEQVGLANVILLIVGFFGQFSTLGTGMILMRFLPFMKSKEYGYSGILGFAIVILLAGIGLLSLAMIVFQTPIISYFGDKSPMLVNYSFWIIPLGISSAFFILFEHYLRALSKNIFSVLIQDFVLRLLVFALLILFYFELLDFNSFITIFFLLYFIPGLSLFLYLLKIKELHFSPKFNFLGNRIKKIMLNYGLMVHLNGFGRSVILMTDTIMLTALSGLKEVGIFTTMVFLSNALFVPYVALIRNSVPHVPKYWKSKDLNGLNNLYKKVSIIGFFITFTLFSMVWFSIDIALSFLPDIYQSGKYVFLFLMLGRLCDTIGGINGDILLTSKKYRIEVWITLPLILIVFYLNYLFIPKYGGIGAAITTSFVYFIYNLIRLILNYLYFKLSPFNLQFLKVTILGIIMFSIGSLAVFFSEGFLQVVFGFLIPFFLFVAPVYLLNLIPDVSIFTNQILAKFKN